MTGGGGEGNELEVEPSYSESRPDLDGLFGGNCYWSICAESVLINQLTVETIKRIPSVDKRFCIRMLQSDRNAVCSMSPTSHIGILIVVCLSPVTHRVSLDLHLSTPH